MRRIVLFAGLVLIFIPVLTACGGSSEPTPTPTTLAPTATLVPTQAPPTSTPEPTPTPLSLSDVGGEFRTFVNEAHNYAIQVPLDWEVTPRGAAHAKTVNIAMPGVSQIRGANVLPPLALSITALGNDAGYTSFEDIEANRSFGDNILDKADIDVNGLPARRIRSQEDVYGNSLYYIVQHGEQFFVIHVYGYEQAPAQPIVQTFGPVPDLPRDSVAGQIQALDAQTRTMSVVSDNDSSRQATWFTDTEILPDSRVEGHIDAGDRVRVEGIVTDGGGIQATAITFLPPDYEGGEPVLEFRRTGGVAGFQDTLVVFSDGMAHLQHGADEVVEKKLPEEQWTQIKNYVSIFEPFAWHQQDNPDGADNLVTDLDFYGKGRFEAVFDNQEEIVNYVQDLLATLE